MFCAPSIGALDALAFKRAADHRGQRLDVLGLDFRAHALLQAAAKRFRLARERTSGAGINRASGGFHRLLAELDRALLGFIQARRGLAARRQRQQRRTDEKHAHDGTLHEGWCHGRGLNSRPHPYQGCALPLSYRGGPEGGASSPRRPGREAHRLAGRWPLQVKVRTRRLL